MSFDCFVCFMKKDWEGDDQGGAWIDHAGLGNVRVGCRKFLPVFTRWLSSGYFIPDCYVYKVNDPAFHFSLRQRLVMLFGYAPGGGWDSTAEVTWAKFEYTHKIISGGLLHQRGEITRFWKKNSPCGRCSHPPCCRRPHLECEEKEKWCETWKRKDNMSNDSRSTEWGAVNKKKTTRGNHQRRAERVGAEGKNVPSLSSLTFQLPLGGMMMTTSLTFFSSSIPLGRNESCLRMTSSLWMWRKWHKRSAAFFCRVVKTKQKGSATVSFVCCHPANRWFVLLGKVIIVDRNRLFFFLFVFDGICNLHSGTASEAIGNKVQAFVVRITHTSVNRWCPTIRSTTP